MSPHRFGQDWVALLQKRKAKEHAFNPDQPRDEHGRWAGDGSSGEAPRAMDPLELKGIGQFVAKAMEYDPDLISINEGESVFELNGTRMRAAGLAHLETGKIELFTKELTPETAAAVAAHEVGHQRWQTVYNQYGKERDLLNQAMDAHKAATGSYKGGPENMDGTLRPDVAPDYPTYVAINQVLNGQYRELIASDGNTAYSKEWWKAVEAKKATPSSAVHETLAEMSSNEWQGKQTHPAQVWRTLFTVVNYRYHRIRAAQKKAVA